MHMGRTTFRRLGDLGSFRVSALGRAGRKRGPVALCAQPFGWLTFVEALTNLLLSLRSV